MPRRLVAMRAEGDIHRVIDKEQTRALKMLPRIEPNSRSVRLSSRDRGCNRHRAIHPFLAAGKIERMDMEHRRTLPKGLRYDVQYAAAQINYGRAEDSHLRSDIVVADEMGRAH